jgi:hypothetical protein
MTTQNPAPRREQYRPLFQLTGRPVGAAQIVRCLFAVRCTALRYVARC